MSIITNLIGQNQAQDEAERRQRAQQVQQQLQLFGFALQSPDSPPPLRTAAQQHILELTQRHGGKGARQNLPALGQYLTALAQQGAQKGQVQQAQKQAAQAQAQAAAADAAATPTDVTTDGPSLATLGDLPGPPVKIAPGDSLLPLLAGMAPSADGQIGAPPAAPAQAAAPPASPAPRAGGQAVAPAAAPGQPASPAVPQPTPSALPAAPHRGFREKLADAFMAMGGGLTGNYPPAFQARMAQQQQLKQIDAAVAKGWMTPEQANEARYRAIAGANDPIAQYRAQRQIDKMQQVEDLKDFDQRREELKRAGFSDKEVEEMRLQLTLPKGVKLGGAGGFGYEPGIVSGQDRELQEAAQEDSQFDPNANYKVTRDKVTGRIIRYNRVGVSTTGRLGQIYQAIKMVNPNLPDEQVKQMAGERYFDETGVRLEKAALDLEINRELSGLQPTQTFGVPRPGAPGAAPGAPGAAATTPTAPAPRAATPTPTPTPATQPPTTAQTPAPAARTGPRPLTRGERRLVDLYINSISGTGAAAGSRSAAAQLGRQKGQELLEELTGLDSVTLNVEAKQYQANLKSLTDLQQTANAYNAVNRRIEGFAANFEALARKINNTSGPLLNTPWRQIKLATVGDPDIRQYLMSLNALDRIYTTLTTSPESKAQLPEGARIHIESLLDPGMTLRDALSIKPQLHAEAQADVEGFRNAVGDVRQNLINSPIGRALGAPQASGGGGGTVRMRAPNGQIWDAPADQVEHYRQKGATVVQ